MAGSLGPRSQKWPLNLSTWPSGFSSESQATNPGWLASWIEAFPCYNILLQSPFIKDIIGINLYYLTQGQKPVALNMSWDYICDLYLIIGYTGCG